MFPHQLIVSAIVLGIASAYPSDRSTLIARQAAAPWPSQTFKSVPSAKPPVFKTTKSGAGLAPGYLVYTPSSVNGAVELDAVIMTDTGELVYNAPTAPYSNFVVQSLDSKPVLSFWTGSGSGYGHVSILDTTYTEIYRVCLQVFDIVAIDGMKYDCYTDVHESYITDRGSILVTVYNLTTTDLRPVNGPENGFVIDTLFYDVDIKTNKTLFRWSALESGIPLSNSKFPLSNNSQTSPFDWFHMNAVQAVGDGYLVNSRHLWTSFKLNSAGEIEWRIQGDTGGDFTLPSDGHFSWQHHARVQNVTETSLVLHYMNNFNAMGIFNGLTLRKNLHDPKEELYNDAQDTFDPLPNGNTLLSYGLIPTIKEYGPKGDVRMTVKFGIPDPMGMGAQSYRVFRQEWVGTPAAKPVAVVEDEVLYVSWNGATGITSWEIFEGRDENTLKAIKRVKSGGFETSVDLKGCKGFVKAVAFRGDVSLASTDVVFISYRGKSEGCSTVNERVLIFGRIKDYNFLLFRI